MKIIKQVLGTAVLIVMALGFTGKVEAEGLPFSVEPVLPSNQDEGIQGYTSVTPKGETHQQEFEYEITNKSNDDLEIDITILDGYTSSNGVIQYDVDRTKHRGILEEEYKLSKHLTTETDVVHLKKGEKKIITMDLDVASHKGTLLGAVGFSVVQEGEKTSTEGSSFQINNKINLIIGMLVNFSTDDVVEFKVGEPFVEPLPSYYVVRLPLELDKPFLKKDMELSYEVLKKEEKLFEGEMNVSYAPKTRANIAIPYEHDEIEEGQTYILKGKLMYEDEKGTDKELDFEKEFKYTKDKGPVNVMRDLGLPEEVGGLSLLLIGAVLLFAALIGVIYFIRKKKDKEEDSTEEDEK